MALTGEEIRANLSRFAAHWTLYKGSERSGAQTFLNELLACYGTDLRESGAIFEAPQEGRFLDFLWPGICIIEMKAPAESKRLSHHRKQALDYWRDSADARAGDTGAAVRGSLCVPALRGLGAWSLSRRPADLV